MRDGWGEDTDLTETSNAFNALMGHLPSPRTSFCFFHAQTVAGEFALSWTVLYYITMDVVHR